jgi:hypothetical protein
MTAERFGVVPVAEVLVAVVAASAAVVADSAEAEPLGVGEPRTTDFTSVVPGAMPFEEVQNIYPRAYMRAFCGTG